MASIIAVEGVDGSGKRTLATGLLQRAQDEGRRAALLAFPRYGQSPAADGIRLYLENPLQYKETPIRSIASLFATDRLAALPDLATLSTTHDLVIIDRYTYSNVVYQCARVAPSERDALAGWIKDLEFSTFGLPRPTLNLLIDIAPDLASLRRSARPLVDGRPETDHFESDAGLMETCASLYRSIAADRTTGDNDEWATISVSAESSPSDVVERAWSVCSYMLQG